MLTDPGCCLSKLFSMPTKTLALYLSLLLVSCDRSQTPQSTTSAAPSDHSRTKALGAASAVGYDGTMLQKQVDEVLAQEEKREKDLEKQLDDTGSQLTGARDQRRSPPNCLPRRNFEAEPLSMPHSNAAPLTNCTGRHATSRTIVPAQTNSFQRPRRVMRRGSATGATVNIAPRIAPPPPPRKTPVSLPAALAQSRGPAARITLERV